MKKTITIVVLLIIVVSALSMLLIKINASSLVWSTPFQLTIDPAQDSVPSISQDSTGKIWVFFSSERLIGKPQIWYMTSTDFGGTWSTPQLFDPSQVAPGGTVPHTSAASPLFEDSHSHMWLAWSRWSGSSQSEVYYSTSVDRGNTWSEATQLTEYSGDDFSTCFVEVDNEVWLIWISYGLLGSFDVWYLATSDGGVTWSSPRQVIVTGYRHDTVSALKDSSGKVWVVYTNKTNVNILESDIWYVTTSDSGATWSKPRQITSFAGEEMDPAITEFNGNYYVFYFDRFSTDVLYVTSMDGGLTWSSSPERIEDPTVGQHWVNVAFFEDKMCVVWQSNIAENWDVWVSETVQPAPSPPEPVGGKAAPIVILVNKLSLLAPYIGLTILLAVAVATVVHFKKRKRNRD